jgi:hypothetical protein
MNYLEIEKLLDANDSNKLLSGFSEVFEKLNGYTDYLTTGDIDPSNVDKLLMRATGYWGILDLACKTVDTYKDKKEGDYYCSKKIEIEKNNEKFNSSATLQEASTHVNTERRIRNILESYRDRTDKIISSCQSYLKHWSESYKRNKNQEG